MTITRSKRLSKNSNLISPTRHSKIEVLIPKRSTSVFPTPNSEFKPTSSSSSNNQYDEIVLDLSLEEEKNEDDSEKDFINPPKRQRKKLIINEDSDQDSDFVLSTSSQSIQSDIEVFDITASSDEIEIPIKEIIADSSFIDSDIRMTVSRKKRVTKKEKKPKDSEKIKLFHPEIQETWDLIESFQQIETKMKDQPSELKLNLLPFQREGLNWMIHQEGTEFYGGILADEMGMGKTIQMIALLLSEPRQRPNLIVAPTVALYQWESEIKTHTDVLQTLIYHGANRDQKLQDLDKVDIILTSYNIIESEFRKLKGVNKNGVITKTKSRLIDTDWYRIILDESHYIKDRTSNTSRAIFSLKGNKKWSLSGTPLQNRVGDLYSSIRFLKAEPYSHYFCKDCNCKSLTWEFHNNSSCKKCDHKPMRHFCWWNSQILKPIQKYGHFSEGKIAYEKLGKLLSVLMLRRTKQEKADDLGLPPRIVSIRKDWFNDEEEDFYESLYSDAKRRFNTYVQEGTVLNNYANLFELITKMRLAVNHPDLILKRINPKELQLASSKRNTSKNIICVLCQDIAEDPIVSKCKHTFCREEAKQYVTSCPDATSRCPSCYKEFTIDLTQEAIQIAGQIDPSLFRSSIVNRIDILKWRSSTKIEALVEELHNLRSQNYTIKSIVFSQFVNFLDLVSWRLHRAGFNCCRLDGRMTLKERNEVIKTFNEKYEFSVFLISLKAGGIALNLTEASQVFICDPWWNPAVEDQAMDRIHRLGQHRPIRVTRLIIENSIESRILQLQEKKHALFQSTIDKDSSALARLSEDDMKFLFVL